MLPSLPGSGGSTPAPGTAAWASITYAETGVPANRRTTARQHVSHSGFPGVEHALTRIDQSSQQRRRSALRDVPRKLPCRAHGRGTLHVDLVRKIGAEVLTQTVEKLHGRVRIRAGLSASFVPGTTRAPSREQQCSRTHTVTRNTFATAETLLAHAYRTSEGPMALPVPACVNCHTNQSPASRKVSVAAHTSGASSKTSNAFGCNHSQSMPPRYLSAIHAAF